MEPLNTLARQHWASFARQNYFDPHGIFVGTTVAAPLLLAMFIALVRPLQPILHVHRQGAVLSIAVPHRSALWQRPAGCWSP